MVDAGSRARLIYASSSSVYGQGGVFPTGEHAVTAPASPYGITKLAAEHLMRVYRHSLGLDAVSLRLFTVYGPGQREDMAFARFIDAARNDRAVEVYGSGEQVRDFTFVTDVVAAMMAAAEHPALLPEVMNVSRGEGEAVNAVIDVLDDLGGRRLERRYLSPAAGDSARTCGDATLIRSILPWRARVQLRDGLRSQWTASAQSDSRPFGSERRFRALAEPHPQQG